MKSKILLLVFFASLVWIMSCTKEENEPKSECKGIVTPHLFKSPTAKRYSIDFDITNQGNKRINSVKITFVITFADGSLDKRTAYNAIVNLLPGETKNGVTTVINPQNANPPNPKFIDYTGEIIEVKFSDPEIACAQ